MKKIRLTEEDLHKVIVESVKNILSELDWRTYQSASEKDTNPRRASRFRDAATNSFNRQNGYGLKNVGYGDDMSHDMEADGDFYGGGNQYANKGDMFATVSGKSPKPNDKITKKYSSQTIGKDADRMGRGDKFIKGNRGQEMDADAYSDAPSEKSMTLNPKLKMKQMQGDKQVRNYFNGKSQYKQGKGWQ